MIDDNRSMWWQDKTPAVLQPRLEREIDADVAIIGAGFTGFSTAYHLAERFPERRIVVLEAKAVGNGASGRNGGLMLNWINGVDLRDLDRARRIYDTTRAGIDLITAIIDRHRLDVGYRRDGCLEILTDPRRAERAATEVERLRAVGVPLEYLCGDDLARYVRLQGACGAIRDPTAGQLDGLAFLRALTPVLLARGVTVFEQTPVIHIEEGSTVRVSTPHGAVRAKSLVLGTNAYTPHLGYFRDGIFALHSHVLATEPLPADAWERMGWGAGVAGFSDDLDRLAYGCMTDRGQLVFGGGSNGAYGYAYGGRTHPAGGRGTDRSFAAIRSTMLRYLPHAADVRVAHRWTGPVALTMSRVCTMGVRGAHKNVYFALGYSGHGITLANLAGRVLCDIYSGDDARWREMPFYQQELHYIPPEPLRWVGYHVYTALTGRSPRRKQ